MIPSKTKLECRNVIPSFVSGQG